MVNDTAGSPEIVLLTPDFRPLTGGVAEYLHNLFNEVARRYPVTVLSTVPVQGIEWDRSYRLEIVPDEKAGASRISGIFPFGKLDSARRMFESRRRAEGIVAAIRKSSRAHPRVFIGWWSTASHWWCRALRENGVEYSMFAYGTEIVKSMHPRVARWRAEDFHYAENVFAISEGTADLVRARLGTDISIRLVRPGVVPLPRAGIRAQSARLRSELNLNGAPILLTVCRLIPRKGVDLVLHSVAKLVSEYPSLIYAIAGSGPDGPRLRQLARELNIEDHVQFLGQIDEEAKGPLYGLADIFVLPNRLMNGEDWEGFGIVFLEAATAGTPSIGGDNGGVPDAIRHGETGLLVDPESDEGLTAALRRMLRDGELRRRMGQAALHRAREEFCWTRIAETFAAAIA